MLKSHWELFFVGLSQCVDILAVPGSAAFVSVLVHAAGLAAGTASKIAVINLSIYGFIYISVSSIVG